LAGTWAYFIATTGVRPIASCVIAYVWRYVRESPLDPNLGLPEALTRTSVVRLASYLVVYVMVALGYALPITILARSWARNARGDMRGVALVWLVGGCLLAELAVKPSWFRLFMVAMPAVILFVWAFRQLFPRRFVVGAAAWSAVFVTACAFIRSAHAHHHVVIDLPAGRVATSETNAAKLAWLTARVPPGGAVFAANRPSMYLHLGLRNPLYLDAIVAGGQTTPEHIEGAIDQLESSRVTRVIWSPQLDAVTADHEDEAVLPLQGYLHARYRLEYTFMDGDEVWERP
jgi:hypothetical protein